MASVSLFIVSTIVLFAMLLLFPKREERINAVEWSIVMLISVIGIWAFLAGCINLMGLPINLYSIAILNILVSVALLVYTVFQKKTQRFYVKWYDVIVVLLLLVLAVLVGGYRFGKDLYIFSYQSDDSVRHFFNAKYIVLTGAIGSKRYVMNLVNAIFMSIRKEFTGTIDYQAFILTDIVVWFLAGNMFFAMIRRFLKTKFHMVSAAILTLLYTMAYPLNSMLHGFEYLGMGVLMISYLVWIVWEQEYLKMPAWMFVSLLCIANYAVFLSYTQFAPAILIAEVVYFAFSLWQKKGRNFITFLFTVLYGIGIPGIFCVQYIMPSVGEKIGWIVWGGIVALTIVLVLMRTLFMKSRIKANVEKHIKNIQLILEKKKGIYIFGLVVVVLIIGFLAYKYIYIDMMLGYAANGLNLDGSIYREPYANFILLVYPVVLYIMDAFHKKRNDFALWILLGAVLESVWLIRYIYAGIIGSYYLYKMCFLIWLSLFACVIRILTIMSGERLKMLQTYLVLALLFVISTFSNWESKLTEKNKYLWPESISQRMLGIYDYNTHLLQRGGNVNRDMQDIYNVIGNMVLETGEHIPYFGDSSRHYREYYYYLTNQDPAMYLVEWNIGDGVENIVETLVQYGVKHIFVSQDYDGQYMDELEELEELYSTEYGRIVELN